jgi:hypothetical protein
VWAADSEIGVASLLPSLWLPGAIAYTAGTLFLLHPSFQADRPLATATFNETVRAKDPPRPVVETPPLSLKSDPDASPAALPVVAKLDPEIAGLPPLPRPEAHEPRPGEWVQVAGYTAVARSQPSLAAPVLFGFPIGRPLRVIDHNGGFARIQDLGSGQLGWIQEANLAPFTGGYRLPSEAPTIVAASQTPQEPPMPLLPKKPVVVAAKESRLPQAELLAPPDKDNATATAQVLPTSLAVRSKPSVLPQTKPPHDDDDLASIMQRALNPL